MPSINMNPEVNQIFQSYRERMGMKPNSLHDYVMDLVNGYAELDEHGSYFISVDDLPDFTRQEFASKIMADDNGLASEATGPDNGRYEAYMMPALLDLLKHPSNIDKQIHFAETWSECTAMYLESTMKILINEGLWEWERGK